jgi:two-component system sensor histidine kinase KdpD
MVHSVVHLLLSLASTAALTLLFLWLGVTNPTTVALSLLLVVLVVASVSHRWVAVVTSLAAFLCFNFFFIPPVGTLRIAESTELIALFSLLAVGIVASHLSTEARRRAAEATARAKEAEIERRGAELKSALLAALGHDLKTPLTAVTVAADNLTAEWLDEEGRRDQAEIVRTELRRLNRLFEEITEMARIETHAVNAEPEWVQPTEIVEAAMRQAEAALAAHDVEIDPPAEPVLVRLDPRLMSSALAHLLENAGQYSPPGRSITVGITLESGELQIRVRDRGAGIAAVDQDRLFERFYRGSEGRNARFGSGMGLAITRGLLTAQGGRAWVENHPDGGAVFAIAVPTATRTTTAEQTTA